MRGKNTSAPKMLGGGRNAIFSALLNGRVTLLNGFHDDIILFVYSVNTKKKYLFKSYIENGLKNYEICLHASNDDGSKDFEKYAEKKQFVFFSLKNVKDDPKSIFRLCDNIKKMAKRVEKEKEFAALRLLLDWGETANRDNDNKIIQIMKNVSKLRRKKFPVTVLSAFDISCMNQKFFENIMSVVPRIVVSTDDETTISFTNTYPNQPVSVDFIDQKVAVDFVKKFLEPIIFSMLLKKPMCGYDIIKDISNDYHVLLSQGTVYPLLYSLNEKNILEVKNDGKAKMYTPTKNGRIFMEKGLNDFMRGYSYFSSLLRMPEKKLPIFEDDFSEGKTYLLKGEDAGNSFETFTKLCREKCYGCINPNAFPCEAINCESCTLVCPCKSCTKSRSKGLCITAEKTDDIRKNHPLQITPIFQLSNQKLDYCIDPAELGAITNRISSFIKRNKNSIILLDSVEYLIRANGFDKCLDNLSKINAEVMENKAKLIIPINTDMLSKKETMLIERVVNPGGVKHD